MSIIKTGDRVRSFDFEGRALTGERACYVEGIVEGFRDLEGCQRYAIVVERRVFGGVEVEVENEERCFPPVNGNWTLFSESGVTDGVELIERFDDKIKHRDAAAA